MNILALLDKLRAIAAEGIQYARDPYDKKRYMALMD